MNTTLLGSVLEQTCWKFRFLFSLWTSRLSYETIFHLVVGGFVNSPPSHSPPPVALSHSSSVLRSIPAPPPPTSLYPLPIPPSLSLCLTHTRTHARTRAHTHTHTHAHTHTHTYTKGSLTRTSIYQNCFSGSYRGGKQVLLRDN